MSDGTGIDEAGMTVVLDIRHAHSYLCYWAGYRQMRLFYPQIATKWCMLGAKELVKPGRIKRYWWNPARHLFPVWPRTMTSPWH